MVYIGLVSFLNPDLPKNEGTYRSISLTVPYGCTLNPKPPAATTFCTAYPAHDVIQACWKALAQAAPDKAVAGWGKTIVPISSGHNDEEDSTWVLYHWNGSPSGGAVKGRDGLPQISVLSTLGGMSVPNAELWERLYPILVRKQEFRQDGGGAGKWRGGTGIDYEVDVLTPAEYSFRGEGLYDPSGYGSDGGQPGAFGELTASMMSGEPIETPQYGLMRLPAAHIALRSPGGGGLGNPLERRSELVMRDVRDGVVSCQAAKEIYGVVLNDAGNEVDVEATAVLRRRAVKTYEKGAEYESQ
jgi:N-methylhydantoinase B